MKITNQILNLIQERIAGFAEAVSKGFCTQMTQILWICADLYSARADLQSACISMV